MADILTHLYKIYKIINNIDDKIYIGSTAYSLEVRFNKHLYDVSHRSRNKLHIHMRNLGVENFKIELIYEKFTSNPTYFEQIEIDKYDDAILLNNNAAGAGFKLTKYQRKRIDTIKLIKQKINNHNLLSEDKWDVQLINFDLPNWILENQLSKINKGILTELFASCQLSFY